MGQKARSKTGAPTTAQRRRPSLLQALSEKQLLVVYLIALAALWIAAFRGLTRRPEHKTPEDIAGMRRVGLLAKDVLDHVEPLVNSPTTPLS